MLLYKYRTPIPFASAGICNTGKILQNSELYFARPSSFNDPYEAHIELDTSAPKDMAIISQFRVLRERERLRGATNTLQHTWQNARENVDRIYEAVRRDEYIDHQRYYKDTMDHNGVLSLCSESSNLLLWAHYAAEHRGLCLGFEWEETGLPPAQEVMYQTHYKKLDYWSHTESELADIAILQKSVEWSYEKEWRSISKPEYEFYKDLEKTSSFHHEMEQAKNTSFNPGYSVERVKEKYTRIYKRVKVPGARPLRFVKNSLKEVIFGARMPRETVFAHVYYLEACGYSPRYKLAKQNRERYALDIVDWHPFSS